MKQDEDIVMAAFEALEGELDAHDQRAELMRRRMCLIREQRAAGKPYADIVRGESNPLVVELIAQSAQAFDSAGATLRRTEADALHRQGLTMDEIASLFGVTRQRISTLLREARAQPG